MAWPMAGVWLGASWLGRFILETNRQTHLPLAHGPLLEFPAHFCQWGLVLEPALFLHLGVVLCAFLL